MSSSSSAIITHQYHNLSSSSSAIATASASSSMESITYERTSEVLYDLNCSDCESEPDPSIPKPKKKAIPWKIASQELKKGHAGVARSATGFPYVSPIYIVERKQSLTPPFKMEYEFVEPEEIVKMDPDFPLDSIEILLLRRKAHFMAKLEWEKNHPDLLRYICNIPLACLAAFGKALGYFCCCFPIFATVLAVYFDAAYIHDFLLNWTNGWVASWFVENYAWIHSGIVDCLRLGGTNEYLPMFQYHEPEQSWYEDAATTAVDGVTGLFSYMFGWA